MNNTVAVVLISVILSVFAALWTVVKWNARRSSHFLIRGVAFILMIIGVAMVGLTEQIINWIRHIRDPDSTVWVGIVFVVLGVIAYVLSGIIKIPTKDEAKLREFERNSKQQKEDAKTASKHDRKLRNATTNGAQTPPEPEGQALPQ